MCGIAGVLAPAPLGPPEAVEDRLAAMVATIRHRGPDGMGVWSDGAVGLGHARLAIIDLSPAAAQPMASDDGAVRLVHNGEIYNFPALREELAARGHRFRSRSDTEVIVEGYREWGDGVVERLRGMFAFALWDARARRLLLARDRLGQKPLYFRQTAGLFLFGSEIKAILAWPGVAREADLDAIHHYLTYQYVPAPKTAFAGIATLPPAHYMAVEADGRATVRRYWSLPPPEAAQARPRPALEEEIRERLVESVRLRLISDVPLGAFLSGGVDSAGVVAAMARVSSGPVKTFTIGFDDAAYDERRFARMVAERYGAEHHEFVVEPRALEVLPKLVWHYGQPFADSSALPTWYVSEITRAHVTVALNGDGGDEAFLGYPRYAGCRLGAWWDRLPAAPRRALAALGRRLPFAASRHRILRYARRFLIDAAAPPAERYGRWIAYFNALQKEALYGERMRTQLESDPLDRLAPWLGEACDDARAAYADIHTYLPDDLLVKVDVASMAHGLEARSPFLDHELMAFAAAIPASQKMRGAQTKTLLKSALEPWLPRAALYRPKMGFGVPIERWIRGEMKPLVYDTLLSKRALSRGLFREDALRALLDEHASGRAAHQHRIWALLMLELWFAMWIDPPAPPARP